MRRDLSRPERILITGLPGCGKSTVCRRFREEGLNAIDLDDTPVLTWGYREQKRNQPNPLFWLVSNRPRWDLRKLDHLITESGQAFFFGIAPNAPRAISLFDRILYLHVDRDALAGRLPGRPDLKPLVKAVDLINWPASALALGHRKVTPIDGRRDPDEVFNSCITRLETAPFDDPFLLSVTE